MDLTGRLTGFELSLDGLRNSARDIELLRGELDGGELIVAGTGRNWELVRAKAFEAVPETFLRGDADLGGTVLLTDAIVILDYLFRAGARPLCADAADADDDGRVGLTDAIVVLNHLFRGAGPLPAPFPEAGQDPTGDGIGCR